MRVVFLLAVVTLLISGAASSETNRFYNVLNNASKERVGILLAEFEGIETPSSKIKVYTGALYIRMAGFLTIPARRLDSFKKGKELIEKEIKNDPENVEYRFVRLIMQEQVPPMLHYDMNREEDKTLILKMFENLDAGLKQEIIKYAKHSSVLSINQ
ncbi:MAG: hypothetical protein QM786_11770 [Breznakibacter sp.]